MYCQAPKTVVLAYRILADDGNLLMNGKKNKKSVENNCATSGLFSCEDWEIVNQNAFNVRLRLKILYLECAVG